MERLSRLSGGEIEFLSTHPIGERRARDLREHLPEALREYQAATGEIAVSEESIQAIVEKIFRALGN